MNKTSANLRSQAAKDHISAKREFFKTLDKSGPLNLSDQDLAKLQRLDASARKKLFLRVKVRKVEQSKPPKVPRLKEVWRHAPPSLRRFICSLVLIVVIAPVWPVTQAALQFYESYQPVPQDVRYWPQCERLTPSTDACIYTVQKSLTWTQAASYLVMTAEDLARHNTHLACCNTPLGKGAQLIVWRGNRQLVEVNHD